MWDPKTVNNLEKDIKASAATDYLTLHVAVKHGGVCSCAQEMSGRESVRLGCVK